MMWGDGTRVKFWKHVWCEDRTLQEAFPELYGISRTKDSPIVKVMCWSSGRIHWDAKFCHPPQDWEQESFDLFMEMVYASMVRGLGPDRVYWKPTRSRGFEVRVFDHSFYPPTFLSFPWRMIWQSKVPPRVAFFSWSASIRYGIPEPFGPLTLAQ